jgi:uncharacterized protein YggU (UPF0235/DUF167 family)
MRVADGIALDVRLTPRSARDAIEGVECRSDGRTALKSLGIAPRQVELAAGPAARLKRLRIVGDAQTLDAMLERLLI